MEIAGLPLHPLVVHAAVTAIPLSAALAIAFAVLPRLRWLSRWPTAGFAVIGAVLAWVARLTGGSLLDARPELRFLQTLLEVGSERNSTTIFPVPIDLFQPFIEAARSRRGDSGTSA